MMTTTTPRQAQSNLFALLTARQASWRSIIARCDTGKPFTREEVVEILDAAEQFLEVDLGLVRHMVHTSHPLIPILELMAMAELVAVRVQDLVTRLRGECPQPNQPAEHSQPTL